MMTNEAETDHTQALIQEYLALAVKHGTATESGDSESANAAISELDVVFSRIVAQRKRESLLKLLDHPHPSVRSHAAFHTYALDPKRSEEVLKQVARVRNLVGFSAGMTPQELRNGGLKAP